MHRFLTGHGKVLSLKTPVPSSMQKEDIEEIAEEEQSSIKNQDDDSSSLHTTVDKCPDKNEHVETQQETNEVISELIVCSQRIQQRPSLDLWLRHADALAHSDEMSAFLVCTRDMLLHTTGILLHIAGLPVTIPLHCMSNATGWVVGTCTDVVTSIVEWNPCQEAESMDGLLYHVSNVVPLAIHIVSQVKESIGGSVLGLLASVLGNNNEKSEKQESRYLLASSAEQSTSDKVSLLARLRLDCPESMEENTSYEEYSEEEQGQPHISPSDISKYLLRVGDLGITKGSDNHKSVLYIDLSEEFSNSELTKQALESLATIGLSLINTCVHTRLQYADNPVVKVQWKPESSTEKVLKRPRTATWLEKETLIWSGKFISPQAFQCECPLFLSRGMVPGSPRSFLELLWDSSRTSEYNRFCLGRSNLMIIENMEESHAASGVDSQIQGAKIVKSETKVPFTGLSVVLSTVMHVRQLDNENTFLIVSRSLNSGRAGYHTSTRHVQVGGNSELHWGVNLLRPVPGIPNITDLTSLSHVNSSLVPLFLANRVGIMGVENIFDAFRARAQCV